MAQKKGNIKNLKIIDSKERARELGSKGGKKSGETKRVNKTIKEFAKQMLNNKLDSTALSPELLTTLKSLGVDPDEFCGKAVMIAGMINKASTGDSQAYDRVCKAIGEDDAAGDDNVKINITVGGVEIDKK